MDLGGLVIIVPPNYVNPEQALKLSTQLHRRIVSKKTAQVHSTGSNQTPVTRASFCCTFSTVQKMAKVSYLSYILK